MLFCKDAACPSQWPLSDTQSMPVNKPNLRIQWTLVEEKKVQSQGFSQAVEAKKEQSQGFSQAGLRRCPAITRLQWVKMKLYWRWLSSFCSKSCMLCTKLKLGISLFSGQMFLHQKDHLLGQCWTFCLTRVRIVNASYVMSLCGCNQWNSSFFSTNESIICSMYLESLKSELLWSFLSKLTACCRTSIFSLWGLPLLQFLANVFLFVYFFEGEEIARFLDRKCSVFEACLSLQCRRKRSVHWMP